MTEDHHISETPRYNKQDNKADADDKNAFTDNTLGKDNIYSCQKNRSGAKRLKQTDAKFWETIGNF